MLWCRKCRRFRQNFFCRGRARLQSGKCKTSDFFGQKYGCFAPKLRMFSSKKSDDFIFRKESRASLLQAMPSKRWRKTKSREADGGRCLDYLRARYPALIFRFSKRFAGQRQHEMLTGNEYTHKQHKRRHSEGGIGSALILPRQCHCRGKFLQKAEEHSWHF